MVCVDGGACVPTNPCEIGAFSCTAPASCVAQGTFLPNGAACSDQGVCIAGGCDAGCYIDGGLYRPYLLNPANECERCDPTLSLTTWSLYNMSPCGEPSGCEFEPFCCGGVCVNAADSGVCGFACGTNCSCGQCQ
jgi:hypothetical protein